MNSEHAKGLIDIKLLEDKKLKEQVSRNYSEISSEEYKFDRIETEVKYLKMLKKENILECYRSAMLNNNTQCIIAVEGNLILGRSIRDVRYRPIRDVYF